MKKVLPFAVILFALSSCSNKKKTATNDITADTSTTKPAVMDTFPKFIYKQATVYAGRTDLLFEDEKGAEIMIGISNMPEDSGAIYPPYMLESSDSLEGPPGANPAMVGKKFIFIKNAAGDIREIKKAD